MSDHLSASELVDFHYGGLDDPSAATLRRHLESCLSCRSVSHALEGEREALKQAALVSTKAVSGSSQPRTPYEPSRLRVAWRWIRIRALKAALVAVGVGIGLALAAYAGSRFRNLQEDLASQDREWREHLKGVQDAQAQALAKSQVEWSLSMKKAQVEWSLGMKKAEIDQTQALAQMQIEILRQKEKITRAITVVQENLEREVSRLSTLQSDSAHLRDERQRALEKEFGQQKKELMESLEARQQELDGLTQTLTALKDRTEATERKALESTPPKVLALQADDAVALTWESPAKGNAIAPLTSHGIPVGWGVQSGTLSADGGQRYAGVAAMNGRVFVGTGWGQKGLVAYTAGGKPLWTSETNDAGVGTPIVSEDGETVFFATESCTVYAVSASNGHRLWSRVVGPSALTQPAVSGRNRLFVVARAADGGGGGFPYMLSCLNAQDGSVVWSRGLQADALASPIVENGKVYIATRDGALSLSDAQNGKSLGSYSLNATSAPWISRNSLYFSSWNANSKYGFEESLASFPLDGSSKTQQQVAGPFPAPYLLSVPQDLRLDVPDGPASHEPVEPEERVLKQLLTRPPPAQPVLGHEWSYLGGRPTVIGDEAFMAVGDQMLCWDLKQNRAKWSFRVSGRADQVMSVGQGQPPLTSPAFAAGKLYVGSIWGDLVCLESATGRLSWRYRLPGSQGIASQVVLDRGSLFATTRRGLLVSIDTRDPGATGWSTWGGNPAHNGPAGAPVATPAPRKKP
jgi:outer membrane protein assembly factor BamB